LLSKWPIRNKLLLGFGLLLLMVATLSASGFYGLYAYRALVKSLSGRSTELPLAAELTRRVSDLRLTLAEVRNRNNYGDSHWGRRSVDLQLLRQRFRIELQGVEDTIARYRDRLDHNIERGNSRIDDDHQERETLARIKRAIADIETAAAGQDWLLDEIQTSELAAEVEELYLLSFELPSHLRNRLGALADDVRLHYRWGIVLSWVTSVAAVVMFAALARLFYVWVIRPLDVLIAGSRQVAAGKFGYRIQLDTRDEMAELARAMNDMTDRFEAIRDDLDRQVRERTKQVVRSEQLASVGFLAAGVAHEINNPLASIALCSESLESRLGEVLADNDEEQQVIRNYLKMIQDEAFRCKVITEKLLDFSRMGDTQRQRTEMRDLVQSVIDMLGHMGRYQEKRVELLPGEIVVAEVNAQEMKQVVLNLLTNGLDSIDQGGRVTVEVRGDGEELEIIIADDGCGMDDEVLEHLFEPFFTRRRGGQGTGLGLSITYRIIADHHGHIEAGSDGPGQGSRFVVTLPLTEKRKEAEHRYQAA
jgi:signal transduction histidine kinase